jgi:hypothetical protein
VSIAENVFSFENINAKESTSEREYRQEEIEKMPTDFKEDKINRGDCFPKWLVYMSIALFEKKVVIFLAKFKVIWYYYKGSSGGIK